jgi:hypothetical protein
MKGDGMGGTYSTHEEVRNSYEVFIERFEGERMPTWEILV